MFNHPQLIETLNARIHKHTPFIIGIDGRSASGKTTLAQAIAKQYGASVIHMDDFFLPANLQTHEQFKKIGGNIDFERFITQVKLPLQSALSITYDIFSCKEQKIIRTQTIDNPTIVIVEGAYSHHPHLRDLYNLTIYLHHDKDTQQKRILARNGISGLKLFNQRWIPREEDFFSSYLIKENAEFVIDTRSLF
ncbi:(d)CMP kinase [Vallitaleaceae bacterium 9-2]